MVLVRNMDYIIKEKSNGEVVTVRQLQLKLLELMKEIDRVCKKNKIDYFLADGSCLGAVRHKGFIPWDDDMDIGVSRKDYKRLIKALDKDLGDNFVYHCYEKSKKYPVAWPAMKIRMKNTYIREMNVLLPNTCKDSDGIFIDIFIYDNISGNKILDFPLRFLNLLLMPIIVLFENIYINPIPLKELYRFNARLYGRLCKNSAYFADEITWVFQLKKYKYTDIYPTKLMQFEDTKLPVPGNYHEYLRKTYGENYMLPPKEGKRYAKHTLDINLESNEKDKDVVIPNKNIFIFFVYLGIILNIIAIILRNNLGLYLCLGGLLIIIVSLGLFIHKNKS